MDTTHTFPLPVSGPVAAADPIAITTAPPALIWPGSDEYDTVRQAWNLHADQRPACVCVARSVEDVQAAVSYAREAGLTVAAQTTGHLGQALPSLERTLLLKTALHDGEVQVDPVRRTRAHQGRRAVGRRRGGRHAPRARRDARLLAVGRRGRLPARRRAVVLRPPPRPRRQPRARRSRWSPPTGCTAASTPTTTVTCSTRCGAEAAATPWSPRSRSGCCPTPQVTGGALFFPAEDARRVLRAWLGWTASASDAITTTFRVLNLPPLPDVPEPLRARDLGVRERGGAGAR